MTPYSLLIDATAVPADRSGVGRYVDGLVSALEGEFFIACQARDEAHYRRIAPGATILAQSPSIATVPLRLLWEQLVLPRVARKCGATIIHSPHYTLPLAFRAARVVTFHDATFFSDPQLHTPLKRLFFSTWIRWSARLARAVIVPSVATATELARYLPSLQRPMDVAYHGVDADVFHQPTAAELASAEHNLGLVGKPWIGFLGTIEPRKNVPALVAAYRELAATWDSKSGELPRLALAGGMGWEKHLDAELALVQAPAEVLRLGFIDLELVRCFLGGAIVVSYPSSGEGFGLPVIEAMACGAPVLTTRRLALPEVGGDAVAYSEPTPAGIAASLAALLADPVARAQLSSAGMKRAAQFTWDASATAHSKVFERISAADWNHQ